MKGFKKTIYTIVCVYLSIIQAGCSYINDFYILNKSSQPVTVIITTFQPIEKLFGDEFRGIKLLYTNEIVELDRDTKNSLKKSLEYKSINEKTISIELQPNTTNLIGRGGNGSVLYDLDSISFIKGDERVTYRYEKLIEVVEPKRDMFPNVLSYTIE
ncbi:MAG: hypothetical protein V4642_15095 [Bacteroidota bacterium]